MGATRSPKTQRSCNVERVTCNVTTRRHTAFTLHVSRNTFHERRSFALSTERPGFEPGSHLVGSYTLSKRALSTAQPPLPERPEQGPACAGPRRGTAPGTEPVYLLC